MIMLRLALALACAAAGCRSLDLTLTPEEDRRIRAHVQAILNDRPKLTERERRALEDWLADLDRFLVWREGSAILETLDRARTAGDLLEAVPRACGADLLPLLKEGMTYSERRAARGAGEDRKRRTLNATTKHFLIAYPAGTRAEADLELIAQAAEETLQATLEILGWEEKDLWMLPRLGAWMTIEDGSRKFRPTDSRIVLILYPSSEAAGEAIPSGNAYLQYFVRLRDSDPAFPRRLGDVDFGIEGKAVYHNPMSLYVVGEVVVRAVVLAALLDGSRLAPDREIRSSSELTPLLTEASPPHGRDPFVAAGLAGAVACRTPLLRNALLADQIDPHLRSLARKGALPSLRDPGDHAAGAGFFDHLARAGGPAKLRELMGSRALDPEEAFRSVFRKSLLELEEEWRKDLLR